MPAQPLLMIELDTDLDSAQVEDFESTLGAGLLDGRSVEDIVKEGISEEEGLSYEDDVEPLLGAPAVIAFETLDDLTGGEDGDDGSGYLAALPVDDEDQARETLEKIGAGDGAFVQDGVVVLAGTDEALDAARERHESGNGLDPTAVTTAMRGLDEDALLKIYADLDDGILQVSDFERLTAVPWLDAITTLGATVAFDGSEMRAGALLSTEGASTDDLPIASGTSEAPDIVRRDRWISAANVDQSRATAFLLRTVRAAFPNSDFVRDVEIVERERGIDFEREFLQQFNGPSQSLLTTGGRFAARSSVSDPERLAATMREIYPDLGRLVKDLQGLRSAGMGLLLLLAPDAPAATSVIGSADVKVAPVGGDLYRMTGLEGPGPDEIVFGLIDDVFVVAEDEAAADEIATAPAEPFEGPQGPAVVEVANGALRALLRRLGFFGNDLADVQRAAGALDGDQDGLRGRLVVEFD